MKRHLFLFLFSFLLIASCTQSDSIEAQGELELKFNVQNYEQFSLDDLTRTADVSALNHLAMGIYDATTMQSVQAATVQDKGDAGYGQFSVRLPYGKYHIVFLGYDSKYAVHMDDPMRIYWDNESVTNTFLYSLPLEVNEQTTAAQNITLKRIVGGFSLRVLGNAPKNLNQFHIQMQGGCYTLNAITGLGNAVDERDYTIVGFNENVDDEEFNVNFYAFLPQESCTATITVQAQDVESNTLHERTFRDVPMKLNQLTRYTGDFFATDASGSNFSLMLENDVWDEKDFEF